MHSFARRGLIAARQPKLREILLWLREVITCDCARAVCCVLARVAAREYLAPTALQARGCTQHSLHVIKVKHVPNSRFQVLV